MPKLTPEQRLAKAKEDLARAQSAIKEQARKSDTRRKIILGSILIEEAKKKTGTANFIRSVVATLERPSDKAAFEGWGDDLAPVQEKPKPAAAAKPEKSGA